MKTLKGKGTKKKGLTLDLDEEDDEDTSSESDAVTKKTSGAGKALMDFRRGHKLMRRKPLKHVKKYITEIEEHMGVSSEQPYRLSDYSRKINWGRNKTLMRIHYTQFQSSFRCNFPASRTRQLCRAFSYCERSTRPVWTKEVGELRHFCSLTKTLWSVRDLAASHWNKWPGI